LDAAVPDWRRAAARLGARNTLMSVTRRSPALITRAAARRATLVDWLALLMLLAGSVVWPH
jgi:hypothetical protein